MKLNQLFKKMPQQKYVPLPGNETNLYGPSVPMRPPLKDSSGAVQPEVPDGLLKKCNFCKKAIFQEDVRRSHEICPKCGGYFRMTSMDRIEMITDPDSFVPWDEDVKTGNPLQFAGYEEKLQKIRVRTGLYEAVVTGEAQIGGHQVVLGVCDGRFLMASMGQAVGEKIARAFERATQLQLPVILFACSGGARMQEGMLSLMQMAKTAAAVKRHSEAGLLYITVLTDPTTGGVTASFAMLGDVILAEPKALIGFAGPRVIEQTIGQKLPKGFQRAEFLLKHGFLDAVVPRMEMKEKLVCLLALHHGQQDNSLAAEEAEPKGALLPETIKKRSAWERVQLSREKGRPVAQDYMKRLFTDFVELHGDRCYQDDEAIIGGVARFAGKPVTVIAQAKGRNTQEQIARHFAMPSPAGYRKALRLMKQAEKFGRPVICFVDTPGAFCGIEAEECGQGEAIARNLYEMSTLGVPILSIVIGEGGSGGALAMAVANEVWMMENATYSILSPEGFASILWKDGKRAKEAAAVMKSTAGHLKRAGIVEHIFSEPEHFTVSTLRPICDRMKKQIGLFMEKYGKMNGEQLAMLRYERFRRF